MMGLVWGWRETGRWRCSCMSRANRMHLADPDDIRPWWLWCSYDPLTQRTIRGCTSACPTRVGWQIHVDLELLIQWKRLTLEMYTRSTASKVREAIIGCWITSFGRSRPNSQFQVLNVQQMYPSVVEQIPQEIEPGYAFDRQSPEPHHLHTAP